MGPIPGVLEHQWAMFGLTNTTLNTMHHSPDYGPWLCKNLILGVVEVCSAIAIAQIHYNCVGTSIWGLYQVCCSTREQWLDSHDSQHHASPHSYGPWGSNNLIYLRWLKFCGTIAMAQGQYIGVVASIWVLYQVYCNTREQWLGSHDPHHHASPLWL